MLCPKCKSKGKNVEMKEIETMWTPGGKRIIKNRCGECGYEGFSIKRNHKS